MKVLFIGTGLIGGSFSLAMKEKGLLRESGGHSRKEENLKRSQELGIIDRTFLDLDEGIAWSDWIVLSIPVDVIAWMLPKILDKINDSQVIVDFGSTKGAICQSVSEHPLRDRFIAAHPIAGTEYSGPDAAFSTLFTDKLMLVCEEELTAPDVMATFRGICDSLSMQVVDMQAEAHDRHLAYISHLSHITSFALSQAVLKKEKGGDILLELAGSGFASTVRLAKSSPEMWSPIFIENKKMVIEAIDNYLEEVQRLREMIRASESDALEKYLHQARNIRQVLK